MRVRTRTKAQKGQFKKKSAISSSEKPFNEEGKKNLRGKILPWPHKSQHHLKVPLYFRSSSKYYSFNWHMCHLKVPDNEYSSNTTDMRIWVYVDWILSIMKKQNYPLNSFVGNCEPVTASWSWFWSWDREENGSWHGAIVWPYESFI